MEYPSVTRAGNDIEVLVRITSPEELPSEVDVLLDESYLTIFEDLAVVPEPDSQTATTAGGLRVTVKTEPGSDSTWVRLTGRASDEWRPRFDGDLRIDLGSGEPARLTFHTWRMP